jgi:hypothetical protein
MSEQLSLLGLGTRSEVKEARERLYGLDLWYAAIKAGWTCPPELLQLDVGWQAGARAYLAERQARRTR